MNSFTALPIEIDAVKCELASEVLRSSGQLRLRVTGWSMLPTIWPGETLIIHRAGGEAVQNGDLVLCARDRRFSAHRVVSKSDRGSTVLTRGDAMPQPDPPAPACDVLGKVAFIERNGKCIVPGRTLSLPERAVAGVVRHSDIAARVVVGIHSLRWPQNSHDQSLRRQSTPCQS
jgi:hypothetical protein